MTTSFTTSTSKVPLVFRHIPTEVCENIVDQLYSSYFSEELENFAALRSCALVCRDWSVRAQKVLFYTVHLPDAPSLYRFAAVVRGRQYLGGYVHEVSLIGRALHTSASVLSLFPAVLAGKLPNLQELYITHVLESDSWYPAGSDSPKAKTLPYIPLHLHFSAFLSSFTAPSTLLHLDHITFYSFTEFARMVHALPNLEELRCYSIKWITLGRLPPFMEPVDNRERHLPHFAPKLQVLELEDMSIYGAERLISACGPQLRKLEISMPLVDSLDPVAADGIGSGLGLCTQLKDLVLKPTQKLLSSVKHGKLLQKTLSSWKPRQPDPQLTFGAYYNTESFTRQEYASVLQVLGTVVESWLQEIQGPGGDGMDLSSGTAVPGLQCRVIIVIYDWEAQREWWQARLNSCFQTWDRMSRLKMDYRTPPNSDYQWKPMDAPIVA